MQETIESSMFSRRASVCVYFGMTGDQITRSVLIGIPVRPSFLLVPWSFCRTSVPILIVSLHNLLLSTCNSFFRIGPALVSLGSGASLIYFGTPVMRYAFWHITSILSLSVLASLRVITFGVSRSRLMRCPNMVRKGSARLPLRIFESIGFPSCVLVDRLLMTTFVKYFRYSRPLWSTVAYC